MKFFWISASVVVLSSTVFFTPWAGSPVKAPAKIILSFASFLRTTSLSFIFFGVRLRIAGNCSPAMSRMFWNAESGPTTTTSPPLENCSPQADNSSVMSDAPGGGDCPNMACCGLSLSAKQYGSRKATILPPFRRY